MAVAKTFLAFDLGATSGRAILGRLSAGALTTQEIHRFPNEPVSYNSELHWDMPRLWFEMRKALDAAPDVDAIGVDTWGVDYALLGERGTLLENPYHYRDARTEGMMEGAIGVLSREAIYNTTGIQFMPINTLYQLYAAAERTPALLSHARTLLTIPDLLNYWLTGVICAEYTNATTTQFLDHSTRRWATNLLRPLKIPEHFLAPIVMPGTVIGPLRPELKKNAAAIAPACHDTGSAVAAVNAGGRTAFLSSGTWSLLGTEVAAPIVTEQARRLNFTNEGGVEGTVRLLKNITGMWILEGCRALWQSIPYDQLLHDAAAAEPLRHLIDPDAPDFVRPANMAQAIRDYCQRTGQPAPATPGAYARAIMESLALKYRLVLEQLETLTNQRFEEIRVIGGGSQNAMLNQFTANAAGRRVVAGPAEATALGNIVMQMVGSRAVSSLAEGREIIARSFPARVFDPQPDARWDSANRRYATFTHPR